MLIQSRTGFLAGIGVIAAVVLGILIWFPIEINSLLYKRPFYPTYSAETLWDTPLPLPDVISQVPRNVRLGSQFCVEIDTFQLWEPAEDDVYDAVMRTSSMTVDSEVINPRDISVGMLTIILARFDEAGNLIGSHGGDISICLEPTEWTSGLHVATVSFASNGASTYTHQWAFQVSR